MNIQELYPTSYSFDIKGINIDSKIKGQECLFICIKGENYDGHNYVNEAIENGAICIITEKDLDISIPYIKVSDTKDELARIASIFYQNPSSKMNLIGVTGTDGKTTVATIIKQVVFDTGYIGTNGIDYLCNHYYIKNTTPNPIIINSFLNDMFNSGIKNCAMEVSSQAILGKRINYLPFQIAIFTNLTHEHLDSHHTMEEYFQTKAQLFSSLDKDSLAIINIDSPYGKRLTKMTKAKVITYSTKEKATLRALNIRFDSKGSVFDLEYKYRIYKRIETNLIGKYNVSNILACIGVFFDLGIPFKEIREKLSNLKPIEGRMHMIENGKFLTIVDFAHTPNALYNLLETSRKFTKNNLIILLGATGKRDASKRSLMGQIATEMADFVIFTEEDSYDEALEKIISDLTADVKRENYIIIPSRKEAIRHLSKIASYNDTILITGKGNEKTMSTRNTVIEYNDIEEISKYL